MPGLTATVYKKDQIVHPAGDQRWVEPVEIESAGLVIDDGQGRIAVLVFRCPDIARGRIDLQSIEVSRIAPPHL
jgi:hypothetical protein